MRLIYFKLLSVLACIAALAACVADPFRTLQGVEVTQGSVSFHYVRGISGPVGFFYETGSTVQGERGRAISFDSVAPIVSARSESVEVRIFGTVTDDQATQALAQKISYGLAGVQTDIWSGSSRRPVTVDLLIRGEEFPQSIFQRRRLDDAEGWMLTFAINPRLANDPALHGEPVESIAHELYHLLVKERGPTPDRLGGQHGDMYEEVTAALYGRCATLLAGEATTFAAEPLFTVSFETEAGERQVYAPLPDVWLNRLMQDIESDFESNIDVPYLLHVPLRITAFNELSRGQWRLEPDTPEAERLISICREYAPNPTAIRFWLDQIATDGRFYELYFPNGEPAIPENRAATTP